MTNDIRKAQLAAANNADLYALIFTAHGLTYSRTAAMFVSPDDPPPYYGNMTTLDPDSVEEQMATIAWLKAKRPNGIGVKDGFCRLDLASLDFRPLFDASWLWAPAEAFRDRDAEGWERIQTAADLALWEDAWQRSGSPADRRVFPENLLAEEAIAFFGRRAGDGYSAGCIVNRSKYCVGLSNVFGEDDGADPATIAARFAQGMPIVSYASGDDLRALQVAGFTEIGRLRIWVTGD